MSILSLGCQRNAARPERVYSWLTSRADVRFAAEAAGLPKASLIKPVLATIEHGLILRTLGALQGADVQSLRSALRQILE